MTQSLISPDKADTILQLPGWSDGDLFPLGNGRLAEYDHERRTFVIKERGTFIGEVPFRALKDIRDGK